MDKNRIVVLFRYLRIKPYLAFITRKIGYELVGDSRSWWQFPRYKFFSRALPSGILNIPQDPYISPFKIDINSITSRVGFSYNQEDWHPFVETLNEYVSNNNLSFQDSSLSYLYSTFQPKNIQEVLLENYKKPLPPIINWPADNILLSRLWTLNKYSLKYYLKILTSTPKRQGWIYFGPHFIQYANTEFKRLISVFNSIKQDGYKPDLMEKDPINGYFLKKNDTYRFVLLQGNHRVSALKVLGCTEVSAVIRPGHPAVIDRDKLDKYTVEDGGIYSKEVAEYIFDALFEGKGSSNGKSCEVIRPSQLSSDLN